MKKKPPFAKFGNRITAYEFSLLVSTVSKDDLTQQFRVAGKRVRVWHLRSAQMLPTIWK